MAVKPQAQTPSNDGRSLKWVATLMAVIVLLAGFAGCRGPAPRGSASARRLSVSESVAAVDKETTRLAQSNEFAGVILIAQGDKILLEKAYGFADRENHVFNTTDTKFRIGSVGKMFTSVAILQLVERKNVDIGATVGKYIPDYPNSDLASRVTVRQLLTHTGGTGDIFTPDYQKQRLNVRTLADYVELYGSRGVGFKPGDQWSYSNYGYILLGRIVEKVSGVSYYDYVRSHIFDVLRMNNTDFVPESVVVPNRSVGYTAKYGTWINNIDTLPWRGTSAGGGYSTAHDLYLFVQGLCGGKLVSSRLFEDMTSKQVNSSLMPSNAGYGFGVHVLEGPQGKSFGNTGAAPGMNGEVEYYHRTNTVIVVLSNVDPPSAMKVVDIFARQMPTDPKPVIRTNWN